jgi:putative ABC transport system permease protein
MPDPSINSWTEHLRPRLAGLRLSPTREAEIIEELSQDLDQRYEALRADGASDVEAHRLALEELCEPEALSQQMQSLRQAHVASPITPGAPNRFFLMGNVWQDVRYGFRGLVRQPAFTTVAILTLALGIGPAAAIFSVIQNVLLDPAPYADLDRVVYMQIRDRNSPNLGGRTWYSVPEFLEYQEQSQSFDAVIAGSTEDVLLRTADGTEQFRGALVTPNTFPFVGLPPVLGRVLSSTDAEPAATPVFVMSHQMWLSRYGGDPGVVGRTFVLNAVSTICVGVMSARFTKQAADLWKPVALSRADPEMSGRQFRFQAKLKPGVTLEQASSEMNVIARRIAQVYPANYPDGFTVHVVRWVDNLVRQFRTTLYTLFAAVVVLLLIACGNIANMLLARGAAREKELAIRTSIGASRWLLIRQLLVENILLALAGAGLGCLLAFAGIKALAGIVPQGTIPNEVVLRMNVPVLVFSLAVGVLTAFIFGLMPAMQIAKGNLADQLKDSGRGIIGGLRSGRLRGALVVTQLALSLVLLTGAGLLMRSFIKLQTIDLGLNPDNVLFARLPLPPDHYKTAVAKQRFFEGVLARVQALLGVLDAAHASSLPFYGAIGTEIDIPGRIHTERWQANYQLCSEGYFPTLGLQLVRGRVLSDSDVANARKVAVVNQALVGRYFGGDNPVGRQIRLKQLESLPDGDAVPHAVFEIIGVISDAKNRGIIEPAQPEAFVPYTITGAFPRAILVRTDDDPEGLISSVRREVWAADGDVAMTDVGTLNWYLKQFSYAEPRFSLVLLGTFAAVGLVLVAIGLYGVLSYTVSRQTREIGIRMALGATHGDVLRTVGVMGFRLIAFGTAIGLLASLGATRAIASQLTGVSPYDPLTFGGVIALMATVGIAACYFPARRASSVDPLVALRMD